MLARGSPIAVANLPPMRDKHCTMVSTSDDRALAKTIEILGNDGVVALPTETVYGLGAAVSSERAVARVFEIKGRPRTHPLIVHLAHPGEIVNYSDQISADALLCANSCWPGPFTMLVRRNDTVPADVVGGSDLVALRVPANTFTRGVISLLGNPVAAPSANLFGKVSPTTAQHVCEDLGQLVDLIVDDGPCTVGVESTIIDFTEERARLVRPGGLPIEDISRVLGYQVENVDKSPAAPGTLPIHYQPRAEVRLLAPEEDSDDLAASLRRRGRHVVILRHIDTPALLASTLYSQLRAADDQRADVIIAKLPSTTGLGLAIRDRLQRAAARP